MIETIITAFISSAIGLLLGYFVSTAKSIKKREDNEKSTLQALLRNAITTKYYVYKELGNIPEYERKNLMYLYEEYQKWGGNSYIKQIVKELLEIEIKN